VSICEKGAIIIEEMPEISRWGFEKRRTPVQ
jgi:hypothetical protein